MEVKYKAFAKINLTLDLTGILPNGYHSIFTCMQSVGLFDTVTVKSTDTAGITLRCSAKYIPCDERNTAYKAAKLFFEKAGIEPSCEIYIKKVIPSGAGLAGGSADAAAVIKGLMTCFPDRITHRDALAIALSVGADVPFCYLGGSKICMNIGEVMSSVPPLYTNVVIAKPFERVSTKDAYERFDSATDLSHPDNNSFLFYAAKGEYTQAVQYASNIFETLCDVESGSYIKNVMLESGAWFTSMSGSGSAYYGLFDNKDDARKCADALRGRVESVFVTSTKNRGIE